MPTVELNRKVVERLMGKKLSTEKLKDRISMIGTDLERVDDEKIVVEVFPNRPDMLSEAGFARALSAFVGHRTGIIPYRVKKSSFKVVVDQSVRAVRPFTACAVVTGLRLDDESIREIIQLQEKLHTTFCRNRKKAAIGIYPMENIAWPIAYLARRHQDIAFQPLESKRKMNAADILAQHPAGKAYGHLLEGKARYPLFLDANGETLSMPPIINAHLTGRVTPETTDVFIETSGFDFRSQSLLLNIIVAALADMGGTIHEVEVQYPASYRSDLGKTRVITPDLSVREMPLDIAYVNRLLGLSIDRKRLASLLGMMGLGLKGDKVQIPPYRADILHPIDLVEDIAVAYGYENFDPVLPNVATVGDADPFSIFQEKVAALLSGLGLLETHTYHLSTRETQAGFLGAGHPLVTVEKAKTVELSVLRAWMLPCLLEVLQRNKRHEYPQRFFEMGVTFNPGTGTDTGVVERVKLAVASSHQKVTFTEARQLLDSLVRHFALEAEISETEQSSFIPGRTGEVRVGGKQIGVIGEIHPGTLEHFKLEQPAAGFEIDLHALFSEISTQQKKGEHSKR